MTPQERSRLRALAHALDPVVMIGQSGLSPGVVAEIERALESHELIKIRVAGVERDERQAMLDEVCRATGAEPVQHIGKILVIHRENPELHKPPAGPSKPVRVPAVRQLRRTRPTRTGRR